MKTNLKQLNRRLGDSLDAGSYLFSDVDDLSLLHGDNYRYEGAGTEQGDPDFIALCSSIKEDGVLESIVVTRIDREAASPCYRIIQGHRRCAAIAYLRQRYPKKSAFFTLPCRLDVKPGPLSSHERDELDIASTLGNFVRRKDDLLERALLFKKTRDAKGGSTKDAVDALGVDRKTFTSTINVLDLPDELLAEVQRHLRGLKDTFVMRLAQDYRNGLKKIENLPASELAAAAELTAELTAALTNRLSVSVAGGGEANKHSSSKKKAQTKKAYSPTELTAFIAAIKDQLPAKEVKKISLSVSHYFPELLERA